MVDYRKGLMRNDLITSVTNGKSTSEEYRKQFQSVTHFDLKTADSSKRTQPDSVTYQRGKK